MTVDARTPTLGMVLTQLGRGARLLVGSDDDLAAPVAGASVLTDLAPPEDPRVALICADITSEEQMAALAERLTGRRLLILTSPSPVPAEKLARSLHGHLVVEAGGTVDPASVVLSIERSTDLTHEAVTRRLASLQRSLTQVLGEPEPVVALLGRLKSTCNATVALVDRRGQAVHATGPVPLTLLFGEISQTSAQTQMVALEGWRGVADRIHAPGQEGEQGDHAGWLVAVARREDFPDPYTVSAIHIAAALVEASQRMAVVTRRQERAIRAAVLEEALALRRTPDDPELAGRIASLGLSFSEELRTVVVQPVRSSVTGRGRPALREVVDGLGRALDNAGISALTSAHDKYVVLVVQASPSTLKRIMVASAEALPGARIGIGRRIRNVAEIVDSYHDAQLAIQTLRRTTRGPRLMAYEEFDFATRLFSDIGVDRMTAWAREFLLPLEDREPLLEGLVAYFEHSQNMNAAADSLNIHHNSLRYRLAKVEALLDLSLREPSAVSSLFLALAARELERMDSTPLPRATKGIRSRQPTDVEAPRLPSDFEPPRVDDLGVVIGPGR